MSRFKSIVITGASSGIGGALALHFAAQGVKLYLTGRNEERLSSVAEACRAQGAEASGKIIDVCDQKAMEKWLLETDSAAPLDLVIANAGISGGTGDQTLEAEAQVRAIFDVNLNGVLNTIQPVIPVMTDRGHGQIAIMASLAGYRGFPGAPAYCGSKAAVKVYGEALRGSLRDTGVGVSVICPGYIKSRMTMVNDFPMPFLMSAEKAATIMAQGLERDKGRISFPFGTTFFAWLFMALPDALTTMILRRLPKKGAVDN